MRAIHRAGPILPAVASGAEARTYSWHPDLLAAAGVSVSGAIPGWLIELP